MSHAEYLDHSFTVSSCDMDIWGYLKPTSILNICQESAYMHSSRVGFGFDHLAELNLAWVLSRVHVEIERLPRWREEIELRTWHKRQSGIFALRDYIFYDAEQRAIIKVTTSWIIINIATRRISRVDRVFGADDSLRLVSYNQDALEQEAQRIEMPQEQLPLGEHRVVYSDMDLNHHVNNAKYLEWACDNSPLQMSSHHKLKRFSLNFNHEAKFDDRVALSLAEPHQENLLIEGCCHGSSIFVANLEYCVR